MSPSPRHREQIAPDLRSDRCRRHISRPHPRQIPPSNSWRLAPHSEHTNGTTFIANTRATCPANVCVQLGRLMITPTAVWCNPPSVPMQRSDWRTKHRNKNRVLGTTYRSGRHQRRAGDPDISRRLVHGLLDSAQLKNASAPKLCEPEERTQSDARFGELLAPARFAVNHAHRMFDRRTQGA